MRWIDNADWITTPQPYGEICPVFFQTITLKGRVREAYLQISALGVYEAYINGERVGTYVLAPGWTNYNKRVQFQEYDVTELIHSRQLEFKIGAGKGWYGGRLTHHTYKEECPSVIAVLCIQYENGMQEIFPTDGSWSVSKGPVRFSDIYDGESYDSRIMHLVPEKVKVIHPTGLFLIPQEGEEIKEQERLSVVQLIHTPCGEVVLDFGQNFTGYVRFTVSGKSGDEVSLSFAEILDQKGNFYTDNYRTAKNKIRYICNGRTETYQPHYTFQGFRYVRVDQWPGEIDILNFSAVAVYSNLKRTGQFSCSNNLLNKLYQNVLWGQRSNFLDVPTDCPQRDERMGWTGDAQVFCRAASYNFDVEKFFRKWLHDLKSEQQSSGGIPRIIPNCWDPNDIAPSAWGDAAVICPWQIYLTYGNLSILEEQYESMRGWVDYVKTQSNSEGIWNSGAHYGDWLGLDAEDGSYQGKTDPFLIATAYFYYSTKILCKAGRRIGKDIVQYEQLAQKIKSGFQKVFVQKNQLLSDTQTAYSIALYFGLAADEKQEKMFAYHLSEQICKNKDKLSTGFVGTPYLLYALADHGYPELAVKLLLQEDYPSWLYPVKKGATTIWEHWDGIRPDGSLWSADMNSFNHYAYGSVADFLYSRICGIDLIEPAFQKVRICPILDEHLKRAEASIQTRYGEVYSGWERNKKEWTCTIRIPFGSQAEIELPGIKRKVAAGEYRYVVSMNPAGKEEIKK